MYPDRELTRLALHRKILGRRIARRRGECAAAATRLARPIAWLDRALAFWRRLPPLAQLAVPSLGAMATRTLFPRHKLLNQVLRWARLVTGAVRGVRAMFAAAAPPRR
jgi:hypothetical protein